MNIGQLKSLSETCARSCHMSLVGGDTFLASQRREMLVPDWLDLCTADKVDQPLLLAAWRGLAADQSWRRRTGCGRPLAGISMEMEPPNIESGRLSPQQRWSGRQLRQAEEETSSSSSSSGGGEATVRVCRWRRGHCVSRR